MSGCSDAHFYLYVKKSWFTKLQETDQMSKPKQNICREGET